MRGFSQFIKCLPEVIRNLPNLEVEIAGIDEINYGGKKFNKETSWKQWAIKFLDAHNISSHIKWMGQLKYEEYLKWLKSSWCHVYLTHPFVPSWSLAEAEAGAKARAEAVAKAGAEAGAKAVAKAGAKAKAVAEAKAGARPEAEAKAKAKAKAEAEAEAEAEA